MFEPLRTAFDDLQRAYDRAVAAGRNSSRYTDEQRGAIINALREAMAKVERLSDEAGSAAFLQGVRASFKPIPEQAERFDAAAAWGTPPSGGLSRQSPAVRNLTLWDFDRRKAGLARKELTP